LFDGMLDGALLISLLGGPGRSRALGLGGLPGRGLGGFFLVALVAVFFELGVQDQGHTQCLADPGVFQPAVILSVGVAGHRVGGDLLQHRHG
jgi:hypothetical protein